MSGEPSELGVNAKARKYARGYVLRRCGVVKEPRAVAVARNGVELRTLGKRVAVARCVDQAGAVGVVFIGNVFALPFGMRDLEGGVNGARSQVRKAADREGIDAEASSLR